MNEEKQDLSEKVKDIQTLKNVFEKQVLDSIENFEKQTGLKVEGINIERESWYMSGSYHIPAVFEVNFDVKL